ncbi:MAG: universal stress protein [Labilithrix sp.]|nr:universal stress protein [Labilithrix sp.]MCW5812589.1 universal stress protein [Labilithrix sp.]
MPTPFTPFAPFAPFAPKHILVATDFEDASRHAEDLAVALAAEFGARITLLHVWTAPPPVYAGAFAWPIEGVEAAARAALERRLASLRQRHARSEAMLAGGHPADVILATAAADHADLIVMGTHGRRGLPHIVLGSTAERVLRQSNIPVLTTGATATTPT